MLFNDFNKESYYKAISFCLLSSSVHHQFTPSHGLKFLQIINSTRPNHSEGPMCLHLDWFRQDVREIAILTHEKFEFLKNKKSFFFSDFETPYFFPILFSKEELFFGRTWTRTWTWSGRGVISFGNKKQKKYPSLFFFRSD